MKRKRVYVGCRANVNRSFIVEQMLLKKLAEEALPIDIDSGGVMVDERFKNMTYYPGAIIEFILALQRMGLDYIIPNIRTHQARAFTTTDIQNADLILTMTRKQRDHLKQYVAPDTQVMLLSQLKDPACEENIFDA